METHQVKSPPKKWSHYLFEFLMLFLAISLGFYADNRREHYQDNKREKKYMKMLVTDLQTDIHAIDSNMIKRETREILLDSLINLLSQKDLQKNAVVIYHLADSTDDYETFNRDDRTILQFKNAGGMRIINEDSVSDAIVDYDNYIISEIDWNNHTETTRIDKYKESRFGLFDVRVLSRMIKKDNPVKYSFLPATPAIVNEVSGAIFQVIRISGTTRKNEDTAKAKAQRLIELIYRRYPSIN